MSGAPTFSIVVPVRDERENIEPLTTSIETALRALGRTFEIVYVDDASSDGTTEVLKTLALTRRNVRVFSFRRHLGKSPALECGIRKATGEYILTMDADLQDDPADLQPMFEHLQARQLDVVSGWRRERRDRLLKVLSSKVFNLIVV